MWNYEKIKNDLLLDEFKIWINLFKKTKTKKKELLWRWSCKIVCIILMVLCNVLVWIFFVKALHQRGGSIVATVCSTATNYCGSVSWFERKKANSKINRDILPNHWQAIVGNLIFGETISMIWWLGSTFVIIGLMFISLGQDNNRTDTDTDTVTKQQKLD